VLTPKHNYSSGELKFCQICGNKKLFNFLNLGYQPLADDLVSAKNTKRETMVYPIKISFCKKCILVQNNYIVGDNKLYPRNYHYVPGITKDVVDNFKKLSKFLILKYNIKYQNDLIVDIGCNDGSLLNEFKKNGCKKIVGIEPTDTIKIAKKKKIKTYQSFFNENIAHKVLKIEGKAKIITTTNVFAHTNNLRSFILSVKKLIKKDGIFIIENHYLLDVIKKLQFDTFYHEHLRTYSLTSLIKLMNYYGFNIIDAYTSARYGGNIQAHFTLKKTKKNINVIKILNNEISYGLKNKKTYVDFVKKIEKAKKNLTNFLQKKKFKYIVGKAFPARASILIHYFQILKTSLKYVAEQPTSKKLNYYIPATDIKIISSSQMKKEEPEYVIVLAWHLFDVIYNKWKKIFKTKVKFIKILPKLEIR
jgi:SAM-dependent methyltransferase